MPHCHLGLDAEGLVAHLLTRPSWLLYGPEMAAWVLDAFYHETSWLHNARGVLEG